MTAIDFQSMCAAYWLIGVHGAWTKRGIPKWVNRKEFWKHVQTAFELVRGGTFRGPIVVYDLLDYVEELSQKVTPPMRFSEKSTLNSQP